MRVLLLVICLLFSTFLLAEESSSYKFQLTPAKGFYPVSQKDLPQEVLSMLKERTTYQLPANLTISVDPQEISLEEFISNLKHIYAAEGSYCIQKQDITTHHGMVGKCLEIETETPLGKVRQIQVIIPHSGYFYAITATALKREFFQKQPAFLKMIRSFMVYSD